MNTPVDTTEDEPTFEGPEYLTKSEFGFALQALRSDHGRLESRIGGVKNNLKELRKDFRERSKELKGEISTLSSRVLTTGTLLGVLISGGFAVLSLLMIFFPRG